jgi:dipeptidyl aminopeptidase/acylaminoacyl peptidase
MKIQEYIAILDFRRALPLLLGACSFVTAAAVLTPEQAIRSRSIAGLSFSPDGAYLACVVSDPPKGAAPESHIWVFDTPRTQFREFTFSSKSESSPRWSPDSHTLAFLSNRDERMQVFLIRSDGGEASPLTSGKNAVSAFRWSPDGKEIAFLAPEPKSEADEKKEKDKDDAKVADRPQDLARLWVVDIASKKARQITQATGALKISIGSQLTGSWLSPPISREPKPGIRLCSTSLPEMERSLPSRNRASLSAG